MKTPVDTTDAHADDSDGDEPADTSEAVVDDTTDTLDDTAESGAPGESTTAPEEGVQGDPEGDAEAVTDHVDDTPGGRGRTWRQWIAAGVLVGVLAGAGFEGWLLFQRHQENVAAAQALEAAKKFAVVLTSADANAIDKNIADVLDGSTGEFKNMYTQSSEQLRQVLIDNKASARGTVVEAAVKSATKNKAQVLLFIDQSVSNAAAPGPQLDRSRVSMTMEKVDGRWLASSVDLQ